MTSTRINKLTHFQATGGKDMSLGRFVARAQSAGDRNANASGGDSGNAGGRSGGQSGGNKV